MRSLIITITLFSLSICTDAQKRHTGSADFLEFWIGEWEVSWKEGETIANGHNSIQYVLDSMAVEENFEVLSGKMKGFKGKSLSQLDLKSEIWKQTWVDNQGTYLDFSADLVDGNPAFSRSFLVNKDSIYQRMVFSEITENSFVWTWMRSKNKEEWQVTWEINYLRE